MQATTQDAAGPARESRVVIPMGSSYLTGSLHLSAPSSGVVVCMRGEDVRSDVGHERIAQALRARHLGSLVFDPLTLEEVEGGGRASEGGPGLRRLTERLRRVTQFLREECRPAASAYGYFATGAGGVAALLAASQEPGVVRAVVACGGRPEFAAGVLENVQAPTLLVVSEADRSAVRLHREALSRIAGGGLLEILPGTARPGEEPARPGAVAELAAIWFSRYLLPGEAAVA